MSEARLVTRAQLAALRELVRACETREPLDELRVRNLALTARYNLAALPAAAPAEGLDEIALNAIRYRAAEGHGFAVEDRAWLLRYIDRAALARQGEQDSAESRHHESAGSE